MTQKRTCAMILAAGFGTRLKPLTLHRPKPLVEVLGQPLISFALQNVHQAGYQEVVVNTHHLPEQFEKVLGTTYEGMKIHYSHEPQILDTGGGILQARNYLEHNQKNFLLVQGDVIADFNLENLIKLHEEKKAWATLGLKKVDNLLGYGSVGIESDGRVRKIANWVPQYHKPLHEYFFCGLHVLSTQVFSELEKFGKIFGITNQVYPKWVVDHQPVFGLELFGSYWDVGTPERLWDVNHSLLSKQVQFAHLSAFRGLEEKQPGIWISPQAVVDKSVQIKAPVLIKEHAVIESGACIGPYVVVGKSAQIGADTTLDNALVFSNTRIASNQKLSRCIIDDGLQVSL